MGRLTSLLGAVVVAASILGVAPTHADEGQRSTYGPVETGCTLEDPRVGEISGAVATQGGGFVVANDKALTLWSLDSACQVRRLWDGEPVERKGTADAEVDVEDLAVGPDGTVWLADTGGNRIERRVVHLVGVTPAQDALDVALRMPQVGIDIEAVVVTSDFGLVMISKESEGPARVFSAPLPPIPTASPVVVSEVGSLDLRGLTDRSGDVSPLVTGAALGPAGDHLALRTYTDVYEYDLAGVSVVEALTTGTPRWVGQVSQPQGEAVTYTPDGDRLALLSEKVQSTVDSIPITRTVDIVGVAAAQPRWPLALAVAAVALLAGLLALVRWSSRLATARWAVLGAGLVLALGLLATTALAGMRAPGFASAATVSLAPRDPAGTGADSMELLAGRYVAILDNPQLIARASRIVGVPDLASASAVAGRIDPGTMNLQITVTSDDAALSARAANVLAGLVLTEASHDSLLYARTSAAALPPLARDLPSASQVAVVGSVGSTAAALLIGLVLARRRSSPTVAAIRSAATPRRSQRK